MSTLGALKDGEKATSRFARQLRCAEAGRVGAAWAGMHQRGNTIVHCRNQACIRSRPSGPIHCEICSNDTSPLHRGKNHFPEEFPFGHRQRCPCLLTTLKRARSSSKGQRSLQSRWSYRASGTADVSPRSRSRLLAGRGFSGFQLRAHGSRFFPAGGRSSASGRTSNCARCRPPAEGCERFRASMRRICAGLGARRDIRTRPIAPT